MRASALLATGLALAALAATAGCGLLRRGRARPTCRSTRPGTTAPRRSSSSSPRRPASPSTSSAATNAELLERIKAEGADSPADVYMTVDAGNLWNAAEQGVLQPLDSPTLDDAVPKQYRDSAGPLVRPGAARPHRALQPGQGQESDLDPEGHLRRPGRPEVEGPDLHARHQRGLHRSPWSPR